MLTVETLETTAVEATTATTKARQTKVTIGQNRYSTIAMASVYYQPFSPQKLFIMVFCFTWGGCRRPAQLFQC